MIKVLPFIVELALLLFCVIDAIQTPSAAVRNLPKWAWILLILFFPLAGGIAWLVVGRPARTRGVSRDAVQAKEPGLPGARLPEAGGASTSMSDIDRRLEADLARLDREHEESLRRWEAELQERENQLGNDGDADPSVP